jgi:hypothetical protein
MNVQRLGNDERRLLIAGVGTQALACHELETSLNPSHRRLAVTSSTSSRRLISLRQPAEFDFSDDDLRMLRARMLENGGEARS